jgi:hypothetical protein
MHKWMNTFQTCSAKDYVVSIKHFPQKFDLQTEFKSLKMTEQYFDPWVDIFSTT